MSAPQAEPAATAGTSASDQKSKLDQWHSSVGSEQATGVVFGAGVAADADGTFGRGVGEGAGSWAWVGAAMGVAVGSAVGVRVGAGLGVGDAVGIAAAVGIEVAEVIEVGAGTAVAVAGISGVGAGVEQPRRTTRKGKYRNRRTKEAPLV